jgi:hypothetical protein
LSSATLSTTLSTGTVPDCQGFQGELAEGRLESWANVINLKLMYIRYKDQFVPHTQQRALHLAVGIFYKNDGKYICVRNLCINAEIC